MPLNLSDIPTINTGLSATDIAYAAGLFDGEGCISVNYNSKEDKFQPCVEVKMTHALVILWLQERFPGKSGEKKGHIGTSPPKSGPALQKQAVAIAPS